MRELGIRSGVGGPIVIGGRVWGATLDATALYRFTAVRDVLDEAGLTTAAISDHARGLMRRFQDAVAAGGAGRLDKAARINPVAADVARARFLAFRHDQAAAWKARLLDAGVVTDVRDDVIRFGFGLYQDEADVERLIGVCRRVL